MRIRGCGFDFETKFIGKVIPDSIADGDAGNPAEGVPEDVNAGADAP